MLTPLAVDPAHPFPYISGLSLNLAVVLVNPQDRQGALRPGQGAAAAAPPAARRSPGRDESPLADMYDTRFVPLEDVIAAHLDQLFPGMEVREHFTFRVTRNEDLEVEEDDAENLLTALEKELTRRRFGPPVRLEVEDDMDDHVLDLLVRELGVTDSRGLPAAGAARPARPQPHRRPRALRPALRRRSCPRTHPDLAPDRERQGQRHLRRRSASKDVLLHHPYDSFSTSVQAFIEQAAADPRVLAIKQTLYRTSGDSPDRRRPHRRRRGRQAGARRRRDQGALRRADQHLAGPASSSRPASTSSTASSG